MFFVEIRASLKNKKYDTTLHIHAFLRQQRKLVAEKGENFK